MEWTWGRVGYTGLGATWGTRSPTTVRRGYVSSQPVRNGSLRSGLTQSPESVVLADTDEGSSTDSPRDLFGSGVPSSFLGCRVLSPSRVVFGYLFTLRESPVLYACHRLGGECETGIRFLCLLFVRHHYYYYFYHFVRSLWALPKIDGCQLFTIIIRYKRSQKYLYIQDNCISKHGIIKYIYHVALIERH